MLFFYIYIPLLCKELSAFKHMSIVCTCAHLQCFLVSSHDSLALHKISFYFIYYLIKYIADTFLIISRNFRRSIARYASLDMYYANCSLQDRLNVHINKLLLATKLQPLPLTKIDIYASFPTLDS